MTAGFFIRWIVVLAAAYFCGMLVSKAKMPAILGWLIAGMLLGPHAAGIMP
jgi:predicted Kef-type K+ transport protein